VRMPNEGETGRWREKLGQNAVIRPDLLHLAGNGRATELGKGGRRRGRRGRYRRRVTRNQTKYQVRFDWGLEGAAAISPGAHIVVWVDALATPGAPDPLAIDNGCAIVAGTVGNRAAVAQWILDRQAELADRAMVAVIAAGTDDRHFAVEDLLAAGAVMDALAEVGIDYASPEAAAAIGAFVSLRNSTSHLLSASVTGQEVIAAAGRAAVDAAIEANSLPQLRVLREFSFPS
jgi:2-phosphosulfolactate phosphatase